MVNLNDAKKLYSQKKYEESLEIYEELFAKDPDSFTKQNLISYSWAIYQVHVKNFSNEDELFDAVDLITELIPQADLNRTKICPYTFSVFKVLEYLMDKREFYNMSEWLDLLEVERLDENDSKYSKSRKEFYYEYASKSSLECAEWQSCIEISAEALKTVKTFAKEGDVWHKWRMAKAYRELKDYDKALECLREVEKSKKEWFVYREFSENYCLLGDLRNALKYVKPAILAEGSPKMKVNLYCLAFKLLEEISPEIAYLHAELCYIIKKENRWEIPDELEELMSEKDDLDKNQLIEIIESYWASIKD